MKRAVITDLKNVLKTPNLHADIVIVGSGPAGMTLALEFLRTKHSVILLESGAYGSNVKVNELNTGARTGQRYFPLDKCRSRYFGGSSNCWSGWCAPFSETDFKQHDWLPNSGWPIEYQDIRPYYTKASRRLQLNTRGFQGKLWKNDKAPLWDLDPFLETQVFKFSRPTRFGRLYRKQINKAKNIRCFLNATVTSVNLEANGKAVKDLTVSHSLTNKPVRIKAKRYVLATGGIENARILLASQSHNPSGIGNQNGNVGRYFMEHPHLYAEGRFFKTKQMPPLKLYTRHKNKRQMIRGYFALPAAIRNQEQVLSMSMCVGTLKKAKLEGSDLALAKSTSSMTHGQLEAKTDDGLLVTDIRAEQAPNPNSRVTLDSAKDRLGMPKVSLNWQLSELDYQSVLKTQTILGRALGAQNLSRFKLMIDDRDRYNKRVEGGCHHMGTTRMHDDPRFGVVDKNCKVFDIDNLYMAGSSIFTTSSAANPTLTIVAFALRLSKWLKKELA